MRSTLLEEADAVDIADRKVEAANAVATVVDVVVAVDVVAVAVNVAARENVNVIVIVIVNALLVINLTVMIGAIDQAIMKETMISRN